MPRGRKPTGDRVLTGAERQARYWAAHTGRPLLRPLRGVSPRAKTPSRARRRSRPQRWHEAVAELLALQSECAAWLDALPEALRDGATGEALQAIVDLDLDELTAIEPPCGFGRD
jgi:hypothetical protein